MSDNTARVLARTLTLGFYMLSAIIIGLLAGLAFDFMQTSVVRADATCTAEQEANFDNDYDDWPCRAFHDSRNHPSTGSSSDPYLARPGLVHAPLGQWSDYANDWTDATFVSVYERSYGMRSQRLVSSVSVIERDGQRYLRVIDQSRVRYEWRVLENTPSGQEAANIYPEVPFANGKACWQILIERLSGPPEAQCHASLEAARTAAAPPAPAGRAWDASDTDYGRHYVERILQLANQCGGRYMFAYWDGDADYLQDDAVLRHECNPNDGDDEAYTAGHVAWLARQWWWDAQAPWVVDAAANGICYRPQSALPCAQLQSKAQGT